MANRELKTKIKLRYDLLANWTAKNPELLAGEIAIVAIPVDVTEMQVNGTQPPQILFKVGPGNFNDLPYASAKAADVHGWAKAASKPTYTKEEVGLGNVLNVASYSKVEIDSLLEGINGRIDSVNTNTTYSFVKTDKGFTVTPSEGDATTISFEYLTEAEIKSLIESYGYAGLEYVNGELAKKVNVSDYNTKVGEIAEDISDINEELGIIDQDIIDINNKFADYYTKTEADAEFIKEHQDISGKADKTYVDEELAKKVDASDLNTRGYVTNGQLESGLNTKVNVSDYNTKMEAIDGSIESLGNTKADKSELKDWELKSDAELVRGRVSTLEGEFNNENGRVKVAEGKISALEGAVETIMNGTDAEKIDSLNELIEWADTHAPEVSSIKEDIEANAEAIEGLKSSKADKTDLDNYYNKEAIDGKVSALEGQISGVDGKLASYETVANADLVRGRVKALEDANLDNRIKDYEDNKGTFALKSELFSGSYNDLKDKPNLGIYETIENVDKVRADVKSIKDDYLKGSDKTELSNAISTEKGRIDKLVDETLPTLATKAEVKNAIDNSHTHSNKAILDATTASFTTELKTKYDGYESSINDFVNNTRGYATKSEVESVSNRVKAIEDDTTILRSTDVFVWDCGGAE